MSKVWKTNLWVWGAVAFLLLYALSCDTPYDPYVGEDNWRVEGVVRLDPPPDWFTVEYDRVVTCLEYETPPPLGHVRWFTAEWIEIVIDDEWVGATGLTVLPNTVYLNVRQYNDDHGWLVRHELVHYVTQQLHGGSVSEETFEDCSRHPNYVCETFESGVVFCHWIGPPNSV